MSVEANPVPLRVVPPPIVSATPGVNAAPGTKDREGLLAPLTMRERTMVCAIADALEELRERAESEFTEVTHYHFDQAEKQAILGLLVAFKDATGCAWTEAEWFPRVQ